MKSIFDISSFVEVLTEEKVKENLTKRFVARRKEQGISQYKLSNCSGVSYASIRRFETTGQISLSSLLKLAKVLNCLADFEKLFSTVQIKNLKDYNND